MRYIPVVAAALALAVAACGSSGGGGSGSGSSGKPTASAPGITATSVTVGGHFPLTGPAAPGYSEIPRAIIFSWRPWMPPLELTYLKYASMACGISL